MLSSRNRLRRLLVVAGIALVLPLCLVASGFAVRLQISALLSEYDPAASVGKVDFGPGIIMLGNVNLPANGFHAGEVFIFWHGNPFNPVLDSVLVGRSELEADLFLSDGGNGEAGSSRHFPPARIMGIEVLRGQNTIGVVSGYLSGLGTGETFDGWIYGSWGTASLALSFREGPDSLSIRFLDCLFPPPGTIAVPERLSGHTVSGELSGVASSTLFDVDGVLTSIDCSTVDIPFSYTSMDGEVMADLYVDLARMEQLVEARLDSLFPSVFIQSRPSGLLIASISGSDSILFELDVLFDSMRLYSPVIARDTIDLAASISCNGAYLPSALSLHIDSGTVALGMADAGFTLDGSWGERKNLTLLVWNHSLRGSVICSSVPEPLLGCLNGLSLDGELDFEVELFLNWSFPDSSDVRIEVDASRLEVESSPVRFGQLRNIGATCFMRDSWGNSRLIGLDTLSNSDFLPFDSLPDSFEPLVCCAEDASFRRHSGFSIYHIRNSIRTDMEEGRLARGGSTITMQLAKNLFLGREKTFARKIQEVFLTWRLEQYLTKNRILELYANIVELGPDVFGLQEAAHYYFAVDAHDLSTREVAFLVSILRGPRLYHRFAESGYLPEYWNAYLDRLIIISSDRGWLDSEQTSEGLSETLVFRLDSDV